MKTDVTGFYKEAPEKSLGSLLFVLRPFPNYPDFVGVTAMLFKNPG